MKDLPSYLKDITPFINEIKNIKVEPDTILVTLDVKFLYTSIPDSIKACSKAMCAHVLIVCQTGQTNQSFPGIV